MSAVAPSLSAARGTASAGLAHDNEQARSAALAQAAGNDHLRRPATSVNRSIRSRPHRGRCDERPSIGDVVAPSRSVCRALPIRLSALPIRLSRPVDPPVAPSRQALNRLLDGGQFRRPVRALLRPNREIVRGPMYRGHERNERYRARSPARETRELQIKPSVGLEPTTPSLPWKDEGVSSVHRCSLAGTKFLQMAGSLSERPWRPISGRGETGGRNVDGKPVTPHGRISRADLGLSRLIAAGPLGPPDRSDHGESVKRGGDVSARPDPQSRPSSSGWTSAAARRSSSRSASWRNVARSGRTD